MTTRVLQSATGYPGQLLAVRPCSFATPAFTGCAPYVGRNASV